MPYNLRPHDIPVEVVAESRSGMLDAVRQALTDAARTMGSLERCDATIRPQIVRHGSSPRFEIMVSVTRRGDSKPRVA